MPLALLENGGGGNDAGRAVYEMESGEGKAVADTGD